MFGYKMALFLAQPLVSCPEIQTSQTAEEAAHTADRGACSWTWIWDHSYRAIRTLTDIEAMIIKVAHNFSMRILHIVGRRDRERR